MSRCESLSCECGINSESEFIGDRLCEDRMVSE